MKKFILFLFIALNLGAKAQEFPYSVVVHPKFSSPSLAVQAFAYARYNDYILIIGGRKDGLHRRQPFASMDSAGMNSFITLYNTVDNSIYSTSIITLPMAVAEQFTSTNMEFSQEGDYLYLVGGYGYSPTIQDHQTHPVFTSVYLPDFVQAVLNNSDLSPSISYITDPLYAVTGGALVRVGDSFYLVSGNRFDGRYNPMGNPTYTQTYHERIKKLAIDHSNGLAVSIVDEFIDPTLLHRRDLNVVTGFDENGNVQGILLSGVFQPTVDLPWQTSATFNSSGVQEIPNFVHRMNQYHCGHVGLYNTANHKQHYLLMGGIAEYYLNGTSLVQSNDVPFVKTIGVVTHTAANEWIEEITPYEMPDFLGASAEFVTTTNAIFASEHNLDLLAMWNANTNLDSLLIGYFVGGIRSSASNIFWVNTGVESVPNNTIYEVWLKNNGSNAVTAPVNPLVCAFSVYPNPTFDHFKLDFQCTEPSTVSFTIYSSDGKKVMHENLGHYTVGKHTYEDKGKFIRQAGVYTIQLEINGHVIEQKLVVTE